MIEIKNLHKRFGEKEVLRGVNLKIEKGKVIAVIGPSGTGKSTLLKCLNALEIPDKGEIYIDNCYINLSNLRRSDIKILRTKTSMVFQNSNLFRNKTAIENVIEPLISVKKVKRINAIEIADIILKKVGMGDKRDEYPETLSGGEKQRVGIARAMAVNSNLILFDEPTSALDPELVSEVLDVIRDLAKQNVTMIIVTHEMNFAKEVADEIVFMENGHIVEQAEAEKFFCNPQTERAREYIKAHLRESDGDELKVDFDKLIDRRSTNSYKWGKVGNEVIDSEVYPMWVADMEFKVSPHIIKRLQDRINQGIFGYERLSDEYYNAVIYWLNNKHSYNVTKNEIVYCANTMVGISVFIQSFTYEGEGVLVNTPVYGNFYNSIKGCGRKIIESPLIEYNGRYTFDFNDMSSKITDNTKILLICNPHNPTGSVWNKSELIELCRFCKKHNLLLVSDEVHFDFIFNNVKHTATALVANEIGVKIATIISPGKSFNVAGIQSASIIINDECMRKKYIKVMEDMMYPFAHAFAEAVTIGAYKESEKWLCEVLEYINENRKVFIQFFQEKLPKIKIAQSDSTYLIWVDCRGLRLSDEKLNKLWDEKCKLILSHGSEFGNNYSQFRRFNIACPKDKLIDILNRIEKVFKEEGYIDKR